MDESYRFWLAAFQHMIGTKKYSQVALVEKIKEVAPSIRITKGHLNTIYKERTGKGGKIIRASLELQEAIANVYGFNHFEFMEVGKDLIGSKNHLEESAVRSGAPHNSHPPVPSYTDLTFEDLNDAEPAEFDQKIEDYVTTVKDDLGRSARFVAEKIKLITKNRNQIEQERKQLQSIIEASSDAIKVNRAKDKVVIYENQAYRRLIGRSLLWKPCPGLCGEPGEKCYVEGVSARGHTLHSIREWNNRWYEIVADPIKRDGILYAVVAVIRDITEHYSHSLKASRTQSRLQNLLDDISDSVVMFDENRQIVGITSHHLIDNVERPTDLNSFILYAAKRFSGVEKAYDLFNQVYRDQKECEFATSHKLTGKKWLVKASPVFDQKAFIGIKIVSREAES